MIKEEYRDIVPLEFHSGIHFVSPHQFPKEVYPISKDGPTDIEKLKKGYTNEIEWCIKTVTKFKGYGITFPQIGIPLNVAILRPDLNTKPSIVLNLQVEGDRKKKKRQSIEASYSYGFGTIYVERMRYSKIRYSYMDIEGKKEVRVARISKPSRQKHIPVSVVIQHAADHLLPLEGYLKLMDTIFRKPVNKRVLEKIIGLQRTIYKPHYWITDHWTVEEWPKEKVKELFK